MCYNFATSTARTIKLDGFWSYVCHSDKFGHKQIQWTERTALTEYDHLKTVLKIGEVNILSAYFFGFFLL